MLKLLPRTFRAAADSVSRHFAAGSRTGKSGAGLTRAARRAVAAMEHLEGRTLMSTYYVSNGGNDSNNGTSPSSPWRTSGAVSGHHFSAGDSVLFQGGQSFGGFELYGDGGSASNPVVISSYGSGRANITPGTGRGAWVLNSSGIKLENLNFYGSPGSTTSQDGIRIENSGGGTMSGVTVDNCTVSGFAEAGINLGSDTGGDYLANITITNCNVYNNVEAGILSFSQAENNLGVYIASNTVHDNYGDGTSVCTGNGIMLQGLNGSVVERNIAYNNGATGGNGGVGIWAYQSNNVNFQYNESYSNKTERGHDGDGFDFDADVSNSVMQYNYAFDNDGTGFQLNQWHDNNSFNNDTIRFNVAVNNGRLNNYSNIEVWGKVLNSYLYNNVIYTTPGNSGYNSGIRVHNATIPGLFVNGVHFVNNIIDTVGGARLIDVPSAETAGAQNLTFNGNLYWTNGGSVTIDYGNGSYNSLASFQGTGQETWNGQKTGLFADPIFQNASTNPTPAASINALASATAGFRLQGGSPALKEALSLQSLYGLSNGGADFYGDTFSTSAATIAGADQSRLSGATVISTSSGSAANAPVTNVSSLTSYDIGTVSSAGSSSSANGTFTITASGSDIYNNADGFRFAATTLNGNGTIIARVAGMNSADTWSKIGVMIRGSTDANSVEVSMLLCPNGCYTFRGRTTAGGATTATVNFSQNYASWVALTRNGNNFIGYISTDGVNWQQAGSMSVTMNSSVLVGLAVSAHTTRAQETAVFGTVNVNASTGTATSSTGGSTNTTTAPVTNVSSLTGSDVGSVTTAGSNSASNGTFTVTASGSDIYGNSDGFRFDQKALTGNGTIIARVASMNYADPWAKVGVMIRSSLAANSPEVSMLLCPNGNFTFRGRSSTGGATSATVNYSTNHASWVELVRNGNNFTGYVSADGLTWQEAGTLTVAMNSSVLIGLAVSAHTTKSSETAVFSNVNIGA